MKKFDNIHDTKEKYYAMFEGLKKTLEEKWL